MLDQDSLTTALAGVNTAYYLVHSMGTPGDSEERDRAAAANFQAAKSRQEQDSRRTNE